MNNGTLLALKFKDRTVFQMLSSVHSVNEVEIERNDHRTGLPLSMITTRSWEQLTGATKWWKKVFFHFSLTILNAYILYKESTQSPVLHIIFRRELVKQLITSSGISPSLTPRGRPRRSAEGLKGMQTQKYKFFLFP